MKNLWRFLPGPHQYVQKVVRDIKEGKNVVLCLPEYSPYGLKQAIRDELEELRILEWTTFPLPDDRSMSLDCYMHNHFIGSSLSNFKCQLSETYEHDNFLGRFFWVEGIETKDWQIWKTFLSDYEHVCRTKQHCRQSLFCIILEGELADSPPVDELCLVSHQFIGIVNGTDTLIYASMMTSQMKYSATQRQIAAVILANLALWDFDICERLAEETLEVICEPLVFMQEIAKERNWDFADDCSFDKLNWYSGMKGQFNGSKYVNSVVLSNSNNKEKLAKRVWSAQASVLLPLIEEKRSEIIQRVKRHITLPFITTFGIVNDLYELEIAHIEYQVRNKADVHYKIKQELSILKDMRNALSHLEPVSSKLLINSSIFSD